MTFSIITVTYNTEETLAETILSVCSQSIGDFEYLIVDGKSKDATLQIAKSFVWKFYERGIHYSITSEKDNGIYDAMNKGIKKAMGDYVLFLNSGDTLFSNSILLSVKNFINKLDTDIIYGYSIKRNGDLYQISYPLKIEDVYKRMPFCHQSVFVKKEILELNPFNIDFRICADQDFFANCFRRQYRFSEINIPISIFDTGGISDGDGYYLYLEERNRIAFRYGEISEEEYLNRKKANKRLCLYKKLKRLIRQCMPAFVHMIYLKKNGWITLGEVMKTVQWE